MKLYPFPQPKPHLRRSATSKGAPDQYWDHPTQVIRWMGRNALRRITEVYNASHRMPTLDELEDWISDHCVQARRYIDDYDRKVLDAAIYATDVYSLEEYAKRVMWASNGGKRSGWKKGARGKRPAKYTTEQLREIEGLSIREQAEKLGCSPATIKRRRADLKAEIAAEQDEELDALFGPQDPLQAPVKTTPEPVPDTVPVHWLREVAEQERREAEARVTFAAFAEIEI